GRGVDRDDPGVGQGAAQDGPVQHPGKLDVVEVVALAPQEPGVLLAERAPEADGVAALAEARLARCRGARDGGHAVTSSVSAAPGASTVVPSVWPAAQRTACTMFS